METNGDFRKYFDALNKKLDVKFDAIDKRFDAIDKRFDAIDKRLEAMDKRVDALTAEVGELKLRVESLNLLTTDMQRVQRIMIKDIADLNAQVARLEEGLKRIIVLIVKLGERLSDFDAGKKFELSEVSYDEVSHTLTGMIREPKCEYKAKKRKKK